MPASVADILCITQITLLVWVHALGAAKNGEHPKIFAILVNTKKGPYLRFTPGSQFQKGKNGYPV